MQVHWRRGSALLGVVHEGAEEPAHDSWFAVLADLLRLALYEPLLLLSLLLGVDLLLPLAERLLLLGLGVVFALHLVGQRLARGWKGKKMIQSQYYKSSMIIHNKY